MLRSPPSRRRGLKVDICSFHLSYRIGSPPSRRRGLKVLQFFQIFLHVLVASFAEAWIESEDVQTETVIQYLSPPSRRRGLKVV